MHRRPGLVLFLLLVPPSFAGAQEAGSCRLNQPASGTVTASQQGGSTVYHVEQVVIRCEGDSEIRADEADIFEARGESNLYGNVIFQDTVRRLTSDNAVYTSGIGRLYATGNVVFTDLSTGSSLRGPNLEYYRPRDDRPEARLIATERPHLTLVPESEDSVPAEPIEIDADRTTIIGETMTAVGSVVIQRSDLDAWAEQARYDRVSGRLDLRERARLQSEEYEITGEHIAALIPAEGIQRLTSRGDATLEGEEIQVAAPELRMYFENDLLERLVAVTPDSAGSAPAERATVTATGFRLEADSITALSPGQQLEQVIAIGSARGEAIDTVPSAPPVARAAGADTAVAVADTLIADSAVAEIEGMASIAMDRDWIAGDTVIAYFAPAPDSAAPDSVAVDGAGEAEEPEVRLERLVARGSARSLYRVRDDEQPRNGARPPLNYLSGETIELSLTAGELELAQVSGLRRGVYLDPIPPQPAPDNGEDGETVGDDDAEDDPPTAPADAPTTGGRR